VTSTRPGSEVSCKGGGVRSHAWPRRAAISISATCRSTRRADHCTRSAAACGSGHPPDPLHGAVFHGLRHHHKIALDELGIEDALKYERMGHHMSGIAGVYSHVTEPCEKTCGTGSSNTGPTCPPTSCRRDDDPDPSKPAGEHQPGATATAPGALLPIDPDLRKPATTTHRMGSPDHPWSTLLRIRCSPLPQGAWGHQWRSPVRGRWVVLGPVDGFGGWRSADRAPRFGGERMWACDRHGVPIACPRNAYALCWTSPLTPQLPGLTGRPAELPRSGGILRGSIGWTPSRHAAHVGAIRPAAWAWPWRFPDGRGAY
jgi:hypothetical protein